MSTVPRTDRLVVVGGGGSGGVVGWLLSVVVWVDRLAGCRWWFGWTSWLVLGGASGGAAGRLSATAARVEWSADCCRRCLGWSGRLVVGGGGLGGAAGWLRAEAARVDRPVDCRRWRLGRSGRLRPNQWRLTMVGRGPPVVGLAGGGANSDGSGAAGRLFNGGFNGGLFDGDGSDPAGGCERWPPGGGPSTNGRESGERA